MMVVFTGAPHPEPERPSPHLFNVGDVYSTPSLGNTSRRENLLVAQTERRGMSAAGALPIRCDPTCITVDDNRTNERRTPTPTVVDFELGSPVHRCPIPIMLTATTKPAPETLARTPIGHRRPIQYKRRNRLPWGLPDCQGGAWCWPPVIECVQ